MNRFIIFIILVVLSFSSGFAQQTFHRKLKLMGCRFDITLVEKDSLRAKSYIDKAVEEIQRIESVISSWDPNSETSTINQNAGLKPVKVSSELFDLIQRSIAISKITDGAFDITFASVDKVWHFDGSMKHLPDPKLVENSVRKVGFEKIVLNKKEQTVFLKEVGMKIGFGGIGKGYAADKAKKMLINDGVVAGIINASGDMNTWGTQPNGDDWFVAITNPMNKQHAFATLPISNKAVVTSGDYEKFVTLNNKRYSHIINPKTGYPATGIVSVSVISASAELADALATSVFVMGVETGLDRINQLSNIECIIIDEEGKIHTSEKISID